MFCLSVACNMAARSLGAMLPNSKLKRSFYFESLGQWLRERIVPNNTLHLLKEKNKEIVRYATLES